MSADQKGAEMALLWAVLWAVSWVVLLVVTSVALLAVQSAEKLVA
jgi:hypothetical protein